MKRRLLFKEGAKIFRLSPYSSAFKKMRGIEEIWRDCERLSSAKNRDQTPVVLYIAGFIAVTQEGSPITSPNGIQAIFRSPGTGELTVLRWSAGWRLTTELGENQQVSVAYASLDEALQDVSILTGVRIIYAVQNEEGWADQIVFDKAFAPLGHQTVETELSHRPESFGLWS